MKAQEKNNVSIHFIGKLASGEIFDSTYDKNQTLDFIIGDNKVIPGFEKAVIGMTVGEKKDIEVPFEKAFGPIDEKAFYEVPKSELPPDESPEVGKYLISLTPEGEEFMVKIVEVKDETIIIDTNHPLAGQNLFFTIELLSVS